ncbi:MAG: hypothetical protein ACE5EA_06670 [Nitrospirota bacterium]
MANIQENMNSSTSELTQEKQKAEDRMKDKTDIPIIDSWLKEGGDEDKID